MVAVYSQPDRRSGRGKKLNPSPVKTLALEHQIPVYQPLTLKSDEAVEQLKALNIDVMVVVAYGLLLPQAILSTPRCGCINVHASVLPFWRGAAPIERAILAGDSKSGISIMQMDAGLDTGDTLLTLETPIEICDNSETLTQRLLSLGCQGLITVLKQLSTGTLALEPQNHALSSYAKKLEKTEALIHWNRPALEIQRQINAFFPRSPAYCFFNNERLRVIQSQPEEVALSSLPGTIIDITPQGLLVACQDSALLINKVQLAGKKPNTISAISNGQPQLFNIGAVLKSLEIKDEK